MEIGRLTENDLPALAELYKQTPPKFHKIWIDQCEGAEGIEADYGTEKAMGYLIGEKTRRRRRGTQNTPQSA